MRFRIYALTLGVLVVAVAATALAGLPAVWTVAAAVAALVVIVLMWRSAAIPLAAVANGINLLREQDFSSRLRRPGQPDADRVAEMFNRMMDSMKAERLKNLEQENFLDLVVQASPMGIAICDLDGRVTRSNPAWGAMMTDVPDDLDDGESRTLRLSPSLIVRVQAQWFMDRGFRRRFYLAEPLTAEILEAQRQIFTTIVRTIGHEVNNSLGSVISVLDTLSDIHADDDPAVREAICGSARSCDNLVRFVRGYADIAKLPPPHKERIVLAEWAAALMPVLAPLCPGNVGMSFESEGDGRHVDLDPVLMERVMVNVVRNAVDSIGDRADGRIDVRVSGAAVSVIDNGAGLSAEAAARIFTPFFSTKHPDRGLGLMLISHILRAHRATFSLSTDPETGLTTFTFGL